MADRQRARRHFPVFVATLLANVAAAVDEVVAVPVAALVLVPVPVVGAAEPPSAFSFVHRGLLVSSVMVVPAAAERNQERHRRLPLSCRGPMPMPMPLGRGVADRQTRPFQSPSRRCVSSMKMSFAGLNERKQKQLIASRPDPSISNKESWRCSLSLSIYLRSN